jgi:CheY-like chemotaxis protein
MSGGFKQPEQVKRCKANGRNPGILVADGMASILTLLKMELESCGFATWLAVDGDDALELYQRHRGEIDVVLLDVQMPGLDGPRTLEALQRLNPFVSACFMSGDFGLYSENDLLNRGAACVFRKPFRPADIADFLQRLVSAQGVPADADICWRVTRPHPGLGLPRS